MLRGFVRPEHAEAVADVVEALDRGEIANFHVLKWRLAMALTDRETGSLAVADVWREVHARWPDPQTLAAQQEWPLDEVLTINAYRGVDTRYSFPPVADFHRFLTLVGFPRIRECRGCYPLAERCPTFIADPA